MGWSIDATQTSTLVTNALGMAIANRRPPPGTIIHSDHGTQFTSWAFTRRAQESGLVASMGSIGDCYDNTVIESFWGRLQTELNRRRWKTRVELANALFDYWSSPVLPDTYRSRLRPREGVRHAASASAGVPSSCCRVGP